MTGSSKRVAICWVAAASMLGGQAPKRLYVEPFITRTGTEKLREEVIAELRRQDSVTLVSDESSAELILGGGGETWIKGYRSLNPRSGRSPANGTPYYGGYLSVELRDQKGETLWGDLVTAPAGAEDVSKDLANRIAKHAAEAVGKGIASSRAAPLPQPATVLTGAGATFPYPVYAKWFMNYRRENPSVEIVYEPVGSETGVRILLAGKVDFGASEASRNGMTRYWRTRIAAFDSRIRISSWCIGRTAAARVTPGPIFFPRPARNGRLKSGAA
jgi:hypothetical protein